MTLPTLEKTWLFNVNQLAGNTGVVLSDCQDLIFKIKQSLIGFAGGYWTVTSSSGKNNTGTLVAGLADYWQVKEDLVWATGAHSWIVLTNSATGAQLCIDMKTSTTYYLYVYFSPSGGYATTGFDTSNRPVAADEVTVRSNTSSGCHNALTLYRLHVMQSDDGECTRVVVCVTGKAEAFWMFDGVKNPVTGWTYPNICTVGAHPTAADWAIYSYYYGSSSYLFGYITAPFNMYLTSESRGSPMEPIGVIMTSVDAQSKEWPMCSIGLLSLTANHVGRKGELYDIWWGAVQRITGDTYPVGASPQFVQFADLILPWNGTVPLVA